MTLLPDGVGGSIVVVPPNADATASFGTQRRPLDEVFAADGADMDAFTAIGAGDAVDHHRAVAGRVRRRSWRI